MSNLGCIKYLSNDIDVNLAGNDCRHARRRVFEHVVLRHRMLQAVLSKVESSRSIRSDVEIMMELRLLD